MKNKNLIVGLVAAAVIIGVALAARPFILKTLAKAKPVAAAKAGKTARVPAKRAISKDKGALTVKAVDSKKKELFLRIRAFRHLDSRSSVYVASFAANRMQELSAGAYDLEIGTTPPKIYKGVKVVKGKENIEDIGCITGSINVIALNAEKKSAYYPVRVFYSKSSDMVAVGTVNRPVEILPGTYDIEIGTMPVQIKKDLRVQAGKEAVLDLGCLTGTLTVRAIDENSKEVRYGVRITKSADNVFVTFASTNRPIEILQGMYNVEVTSFPKQDKKDVRVNVGEEKTIEFVIHAPPAAPAAAIPPKKIKK